MWAGGCGAHTRHITKATAVATTSERAVLVCVGAVIDTLVITEYVLGSLMLELWYTCDFSQSHVLA